MKFKSGDEVRCTLPIGILDRRAIYNIDQCYTSSGKEEYVLLKGHEQPYMSYRFTLNEPEAGSASVVTEPLYVPTSAAKNDQQKPDLSLIPRISNIEHAKAFMVGERKYKRYNYTKGHKASQLIAAAKRHLDAWFENEENDPVDGQHHLGSVMACCSMILRQQELGTLKDDRFKGLNEST